MLLMPIYLGRKPPGETSILLDGSLKTSLESPERYWIQNESASDLEDVPFSEDIQTFAD
jgi:hypothetical protein